MKTDVNEAINCLKLLKSKNDILVGRGIAVEKSNPDGCLLFIGMNPSFKEGQSPVPGDNRYKPDYPLTDKQIHQYFNTPRNIANEMHLPFGHHDLFPIRETSQKIIEGMFDDTLVPKKDYKEFITKSLLWSEKSIISCKPKAIVVINAFASRIFFDCYINGKRLLDFIPVVKWNEELGVDFVRIEGRMVPLLFSGMLSGQRALDNQSENRLKWHIRHILRHQDHWPKH